MFSMFGIAFVTPWLLLGLVLLPILWLLLRAVPPAPLRRIFPPVILLLGLKDDDSQSDKTPWWLMLLRIAAVAALIVGFAGPVLNPQPQDGRDAPLLILFDASWASARDWESRIERAEAALDSATQPPRPVAVVLLSDLANGPLQFQAADSWRKRLAGLQPRPWMPDPEKVTRWTRNLDGRFDTLWLSDGLDRPGRRELASALQDAGELRVVESAFPVFGIRPPVLEDGAFVLSAIRPQAANPAEIELEAIGLDPAGNETVLARAPLRFESGDRESETRLSVPAEIRNRITRFSIEGLRSAGAVSLTGDGLKRREIALVSGQSDREGLVLLAPTHYLEQALVPNADLIEGTLGDILLANPDVIVLADVARLSPAESKDIQNWVEKGGLLLRFAGPKLAASDVSRGQEDPLMPVRLRAGGRMIGGAMSWGEPKALRPFAQESPFFGLDIPADVTVSAQVLAEPDPELSRRVIAALADGTPLVTRKRIGQGQVVLFHVTANAEWSTLPLSGLFVQMLERLSVSGASGAPKVDELAGTVWVPTKVLDGFGDLHEARGLAGVPGEVLAAKPLSAALPPGVYQGQDRVVVRNVVEPATELSLADWPAFVTIEGLSTAREKQLKGYFLSAALVFLGLDMLASLWLSGLLLGAAPARQGKAAVVLLLGALALHPDPARAQNDELALEATTQTVLAHVLTGNRQVDETAQAGLRGLSDVLFARTSVEPANPIGVDLEQDELAFFPFLYWPVTPDQPQPSAAAYAKLNRYLRTGGMIMFDTRDADIAGYGPNSPNGRKLQQLAFSLDIPPLEPVPDDHVLTRTFYLLQDFPGRHASREVWVEAAQVDAEQIEGMPFRNLNDNVTPVIIGGNDWAAAWAVTDMGAPMFPVGRGSAGERQREIAYRFGVNLIMYVLTGNYKSDQVHVPALLERLGQ